MAQMEMFAPKELVRAPAKPRRTPSPPPPFAPFPDALRRRLEIDLNHLSFAVTRPWPEWDVEHEIRSFFACVERLPPDMRGDLAERFRAELVRLGLG